MAHPHWTTTSNTSTTDWRPGTSEVRRWSLVAIGLFVIGVPLFALPSLVVHHSGSIRIGLIDFVIVLIIALFLAVLHEGVHAVVMAALGARPTFGVTLVAHSMPALYTTSPGHRFTRLQFIAVAVAPALLLSALGSWATLASWGGHLIIPLAAHLGGCVGDGASIWQVTRQPRGSMCEDLPDGLRFHRPD